jgi:hypothetical protein
VGFLLTVTGVVGATLGVDPEIVRFFPAVGVTHVSSMVTLALGRSPKPAALLRKYSIFLSRTAFAISASWLLARLSTWSAFHSLQVSSTSACAIFVTFSLKVLCMAK